MKNSTGNLLRLVSGVMLCLVTLGAASVQAETLRINAGYWPGDLDSDLEARFYDDDLFTVTGGSLAIGRLNNDWQNKHTDTIYPLGVEFFLPLGPGDIVLGGNFYTYRPDYSYTGIGLLQVSSIELMDYRMDHWESFAGYRYGVVPETFYVTARAGIRQTITSFSRQEFTAGASGTALVTLDSSFYASARGTYVGVGFQYYFMPGLSLLADLDWTPIFLPGWTGTLSSEELIAGLGSGTPTLFYQSASAGYKVEIIRLAVGLQYDILPELHLAVGVRSETLRQSYPDYYNVPISISGGVASPTFTVIEYITDRAIYEREADQTKGLVFLLLSYDLNF